MGAWPVGVLNPGSNLATHAVLQLGERGGGRRASSMVVVTLQYTVGRSAMPTQIAAARIAALTSSEAAYERAGRGQVLLPVMALAKPQWRRADGRCECFSSKQTLVALRVPRLGGKRHAALSVAGPKGPCQASMR